MAVETTLDTGVETPPIRRVRRDTEASTGRRSGGLMMLPFLILYVLFLIGPLIYGVVMSFFNASIVRSGLGKFGGLRNYRELLTSSDFWQSMWHTVYFTILTTPPLVIIALVLALLTERIKRGRWFYRLVFFAPYVVPSASVVLIFTWMYTPQAGLATKFVSALGFTPPVWTGSQAWAMISVALLTIWWTVGFNYVLYLAALQDIPADLYGAAAVDGAGTWATMWRITVPLLKRTTMLVIALQIIASLKVFDQIYLLTSGGPNFSTRPALEYVYDLGFTDYRAGYAAAASMVYFVAVLVVSLAWLAFSRVRVKES